MVLNFPGQLRPSVSKRDEFALQEEKPLLSAINQNQIIVVLN